MAVEDSWRRKDGTPTARDGRGLRYRVRVPGQPVKSFRVRSAADRYNAMLLAGGGPNRATDVTVDELVARWLATKAGLSVKGRQGCQTAAAVVRAHWAGTPVGEVTKDAIQAWIPTVGKSGAARRKVFQALRGALQIGVDGDLLERNPAAGVKVPDSRPREAVFLTIEQLRDLARRCGVYEPMVLFMGTTGARLGEVCALTVGDVDRRRRRARVRDSKNGEARDLPIPALVLELLDLERPVSAPLFTAAEGGPVDGHNWRDRVFYPATGRRRRANGEGWAEPPRVRPHDLRHTAASLAIHAGADVKAVQTMLGHKSATLTMDTYGHLWDRSLDMVAERMDAVLGRE